MFLLENANIFNFPQDSDSDSESENSSYQPKLIKRASNLLTRGKYKDNIPLKKRLYTLVKCVIEYVVSNSEIRHNRRDQSTYSVLL